MIPSPMSDSLNWTIGPRLTAGRKGTHDIISTSCTANGTESFGFYLILEEKKLICGTVSEGSAPTPSVDGSTCESSASPHCFSFIWARISFPPTSRLNMRPPRVPPGTSVCVWDLMKVLKSPGWTLRGELGAANPTFSLKFVKICPKLFPAGRPTALQGLQRDRPISVLHSWNQNNLIEPLLTF